VHPSAYEHMARCVETYMPRGPSYRVVDFGARISKGQTLTHRDLLRDRDCHYTGVDIRAGRNVDLVMKKPYSIPLKSKSADVIFAGQVLEHVPFFWASMLEIARVLAPGGHVFITVPSRGHVHGKNDCWRYYPDGLRAMAAASRLIVHEAHTDFPPTEREDGRGRHRYGDIDVAGGHYWGDSVAVFGKPKRYPSLRMAVVRTVVLRWANWSGDLSGTRSEPASVVRRVEALRRRLQADDRSVRRGPTRFR
jgi:SAM-dependent methyltransferase